VPHFELRASLGSGAPRIQVDDGQFERATVALGAKVLNVLDEVADLVEGVPGRELDFRRRRGVGYGHRHAREVRLGLAKVELVDNRRPRARLRNKGLAVAQSALKERQGEPDRERRGAK